MRIIRRLHIPDCHYPYVDTSAYNIMLSVAQDFKPHEVVIYGDFWDFYNLSRFNKSPVQTVKLIEDEVDSGITAFHHLVSKFKKVIFLCGNHEDRFRRFVAEHAPLLSKAINLENILHIPKTVQLFDYGQKNIYDMGGLLATHGNIYSKHVAFNMAQKYGKSIVFGHTHRMQRYVHKNMGGEIEAINIGWLGDFSKADYKDTNEWSHGFGISYHQESLFSFETVHIKEGQAIFHGKIYGKRPPQGFPFELIA